jgi:hypothetical protein
MREIDKVPEGGAMGWPAAFFIRHRTEGFFRLSRIDWW